MLQEQEQEQRPGRQGLRAGAEVRSRNVLQEQEKLRGGKGGRRTGAEVVFQDALQ